MPAALDSLTVILAWPVDPATGDPVTTPVLFASAQGFCTAPADTYASLPATSTISLSDETAKWWRHQDDGLFLPMGMIQHGGASFTIDNARRRDGSTYARPLDDYAGHQWAGCAVEVWGADATVSATKGPSLDLALSALAQVGVYVCESMSIGDDAALRLREPDTRKLPVTPWSLRGYGLVAECNDITLGDIATLRGTGSFTLRMTCLFILDIITGPDIVWESPLVRLQRDSADLLWQIRAASGSWESFTATAILDVTPNVGTFHIAYNSTTHDATLYFRGGSVGAGEALEVINVTGGLYASAASADTVWSWGPSTDHFWYCAGFAWYNVEKAAEWILDDGVRGVQDDPDLVVGLAFDEEVGTLCVNIVGEPSAVVDNASRAATGEGMASAAGTRLPAIIGIPFGVPLIPFTSSSVCVGGYAPERKIRHVTQDGTRLEPTVTGTSATLNIAAARDVLYPLMPPGNSFANSPLEFASGQTVSTGSAVNTTPIVISRVNVDPTIGTAARPGALVTSTNQTANESSSLAVSSTGSEHYSVGTLPAVRGAKTYTFQTITLDSAINAGVLQTSFARHADDQDMSALQHATEEFGPEQSAPAITHQLAASYIWHHGTAIPGETPWGEAIDRVALSSLSVDNGPMGCYYEGDGDVAFRGLRLDADASDDVHIPPGKVESIVQVFEGGVRPNRVKVRYCRNHQKIDIAESVGGVDDLLREMRFEWREASSGSGTRIGTFDSTLMQPYHARLQAAAMERLQGFSVYRVQLYSPVKHSLMLAATAGPGLQVTIEWDRAALWEDGRVCWTVGWERRRTGPSCGLVLYVITEAAA